MKQFNNNVFVLGAAACVLLAAQPVLAQLTQFWAFFCEIFHTTYFGQTIVHWTKCQLLQMAKYLTKIIWPSGHTAKR